MGSVEDGTPTKSSKPASSSTQEASSTPTIPAYPDWPGSMQALYGPAATPPFFAPPVGSPTPHPFLWGGQHPLMPPYGMPVYPAMYPPGGVYAHPNMVMTPGNVNGTSELDVKSNDENDRSSSKKAKGTSGNNGLVGIKIGDGGKAASGSGHEEGTQSGESGSEGSSDASDDNNQDFSKTKKGSFELMLADGANAQNNSAPSNLQPSAAKNSAASVPPAHLNMGMDLWNASSAGSGPMRLSPNQYASPHVAPPGMDERELKRQKRKQSNRESARRSRLRKQAECEDLQHRVEILSNENLTLRDELRRLSEECENLTSENNSIKEELVRLYGPEAMSKLEDNNSDAQERDEDDN